MTLGYARGDGMAWNEQVSGLIALYNDPRAPALPGAEYNGCFRAGGIRARATAVSVPLKAERATAAFRPQEKARRRSDDNQGRNLLPIHTFLT